MSSKHPWTGREAAPRASPLCFHPFFSFHQEHSALGEAFRALLGLCCRQGRWEEPQLKGDPRAPFSFLGFQPFLEAVRPVSNKWIARAPRTDGHVEIFQSVSTIFVPFQAQRWENPKYFPSRSMPFAPKPPSSPQRNDSRPPFVT